MLQAGTVAKLTVVRSVPFGFIVSDGRQELLLHQNETVGTVKVQDEVTVFLYHDHQNRLAATMHSPILTLHEAGWLEVRSVTPRLGVFLDNGVGKDLLLPRAELPKLRDRWPKEGYKLFVKLVHDRQGRMLAKLGKEEDLVPLSKPADKKLHHKEVEGRVYNETQLGAFVFTEEGYIGLIHRDEMTFPLPLGALVRARVTHVREDGRINFSMKPSKEVSLSIDAQKIFTYLKQRDGHMPYGDHTDAEIIQNKFQMSKSAFKRALGRLMKEGIIEQKDGWTVLVNHKKI